jgi:hypothetical protein
MQSGLARLGLIRALALPLCPLLLAGALLLGTRHYCAVTNQQTNLTATALTHARELQATAHYATATLHAIPNTPPSYLSESEDFGRWLNEAGNQHYIQLQQLAIKNEPTGDPIKPPIRSSFRVEAPLPQIILLLHNLQRFPQLVGYDALHLHHGSPSTPPRYVADITLHLYALTRPARSLPQTAPPATPSTLAQLIADRQQITLIRQKANLVQRQLHMAATGLNLADYIQLSPPPVPPPPPTNVIALAIAPPPPEPTPAPEPLFVLRGISFSSGKPLTLLNNRWRQVDDLVTSNGGWRVARIEPTGVVLVNTQGVQRTIPLYPTRTPAVPPPPMPPVL